MRTAIFIVLISLISNTGFAQEQARHLPFTREQNLDGAKFVWFMHTRVGLKYEYFPAADLPNSPYFARVEQPKSGDVAFWSEYVAIIDVKQENSISAMVAGNEYTFDQLSQMYGSPSYFRFIINSKKP